MSDGQQASDSGSVIGTNSTNLADAAVAIVKEPDLTAKTTLAKQTAKAWFTRRISLHGPGTKHVLPDTPGRPDKPELLPPRKMPKRSTSGERGRFALLHSLAHIELSAVDMTWDLIARFVSVGMPQLFYDNWVQVGLEEAKHFDLLRQRLEQLGGSYGDLPAHAGLWQAAQETKHDLLARLAIVPLVLEARGLDVGPEMIKKLEKAGDQKSADILKIVYRDEKKHVAIGMYWFRFMCQREARPIEQTFQTLVRKHFRSPIRPPFNEEARLECGMPATFYKPLTAFGAPS